MNFWPHFPFLSILSIFLPALSIFIQCFQRNLLQISMSHRSLIVSFAKIGLVQGRTLFKGVITIALFAVILAQFGRNTKKKIAPNCIQ